MIPKPKAKFKIQIFATDIDREAIDAARHGSYPANIATDVSPERLRFFYKRGSSLFYVGKLNGSLPSLR
jgi:two-component system CheB/CheR fusion protein